MPNEDVVKTVAQSPIMTALGDSSIAEKSAQARSAATRSTMSCYMHLATAGLGDTSFRNLCTGYSAHAYLCINVSARHVGHQSTDDNEFNVVKVFL